MPTGSTRNAGDLRKVAEALRKWDALGCQETPETRRAARQALRLACDALPLLRQCADAYGLPGHLAKLLEWLGQAASERANGQDLGGYWAWWQEMTQKAIPARMSLPEQIERWAAELDKVPDVVGDCAEKTPPPTGTGLTAEERARRIALEVHELAAVEDNLAWFRRQVAECAAEQRRLLETERCRRNAEYEAFAQIVVEQAKVDRGRAAACLTDRAKPPAPGWVWCRGRDAHSKPAAGWIPAEVAEGMTVPRPPWPEPNPSLALRATLLAFLHDALLPHSTAIVDAEAHRAPEFHQAGMWCHAARKGNSERLEALTTYLADVRNVLASGRPGEKGKPMSERAPDPQERARRLALKVDRLYHGTPNFWAAQVAAFEAEYEAHKRETQENEEAISAQARAILAEERAVKAGRRKRRRLTDLDNPPRAGYRISNEPAEWRRTAEGQVEVSYGIGWYEKRLVDRRSELAEWPWRPPTLAMMTTALALLHDTVLPDSPPILGAAARSRAIGELRDAVIGDTVHFGVGEVPDTWAEPLPWTRERIGHLMAYLNAVRADLKAAGLDEAKGVTVKPDADGRRVQSPAGTTVTGHAEVPNVLQEEKVDENAPLSPKTLAKVFKVPAEALRKRLERFRAGHMDGFVQVDNHKSREPQFLYRVRDVHHIIEALRASSKTSGKRPARKKSR